MVIIPGQPPPVGVLIYSPGIQIICYPDPAWPQARLEVQWAPDSGGSPGTWTTFETLQSGEMMTTLFTDSDDNYYWFRCRHVGAGFEPSDWSNQVKAKPIEDVNAPRRLRNPRQLGNDEINAATQVQDGSITTSLFQTGLTPVEVVSALPETGNFEGRAVYLTTDDKLYRHTGSPAGSGGFTRAVDGLDLTANSVTTNAIQAGAVTAAKIAVTQLDAITANMGTLTAGTVRDTANKFLIELSSRLITMIDEQVTPRTRVLIGEVGGAANGWGIELRDENNLVVMQTHGARTSTLLDLYVVRGGTLVVKDEGSATLDFRQTKPSDGIAAQISATYSRLEIIHYSDAIGTITSKLHVGGSTFGITGTVASGQNFTISLAGGGILSVTGGSAQVSGDVRVGASLALQVSGTSEWELYSPTASSLVIRETAVADRLVVTSSAFTRASGSAMTLGTDSLSWGKCFIEIGSSFTPFYTTEGVELTVDSATSGGRTGIMSHARYSGGAGDTSKYAVFGYAEGTHTSGTQTILAGVTGIADHSGSGGTTTWLRGVLGLAGRTTAGTVTNAASLFAAPTYGTVTSAYGIYVDTISNGTNANYGLWLQDPGGTSPVTIGAQSGATLTTAGVWTDAPSYRRLKREIEVLGGARLRRVLKELRPVSFRRRDTGARSVHFIMEEYRATMEKHQLVDFARDGIASQHLATLAIAGWRLHEDALDRLRRRVRVLEKQIAHL